MRAGYLYRRSPNAGMLPFCLLAALCILGSMVTFFYVGFGGASKAQAQAPIFIGDQTKVVSMRYVTAVNPDTDRKTDKKAAKYGDRCAIMEGGYVEVVGTHKKRVLLRYRLYPKAGDMVNTSCPDNTLFFADRLTYRRIVNELRDKNAKEKATKDLVRRLLNVEVLIKKPPVEKPLPTRDAIKRTL